MLEAPTQRLMLPEPVIHRRVLRSTDSSFDADDAAVSCRDHCTEPSLAKAGTSSRSRTRLPVRSTAVR